MSLSSRNLILLMVAENMRTFVRSAVLSLFIARNRVFLKEIYLARLALDAFRDDNVTITPEFDLADAERLVKNFFELYKCGSQTDVRILEHFESNYC
jgi:hypothetical protein